MRSVEGAAVALEDSAEAAEQVLRKDAAPGSQHPDASRQAGIARSVATAAHLLPSGPQNGRTSTGARQAMAALRPHASASSRLAASSSQKPPTCSLVSR